MLLFSNFLLNFLPDRNNFIIQTIQLTRRISFGRIRVFPGRILSASGPEWTNIELDELY
jgi:hypothetical protein